MYIYWGWLVGVANDITMKELPKVSLTDLQLNYGSQLCKISSFLFTTRIKVQV
jgi:hypothetical protein